MLFLNESVVYFHFVGLSSSLSVHKVDLDLVFLNVKVVSFLTASLAFS